MRQLQRALLAALIVAGASAITACDNTTAPDINWQLQVALTQGSNRPAVGDRIRFGAFIVRGGVNGTISEDSVNVTDLTAWSFSGPPGIVSVEPSGYVTALAPGAAIIVASYGGKTGDMSLVVE